MTGPVPVEETQPLSKKLKFKSFPFDWRQDACVTSISVFLARIGGSLASWEYEVAGDCDRFFLDIDLIALGDFRLAPMGIAPLTPQFVGAGDFNLDRRDGS